MLKKIDIRNTTPGSEQFATIPTLGHDSEAQQPATVHAPSDVHKRETKHEDRKILYYTTKSKYTRLLLDTLQRTNTNSTLESDLLLDRLEKKH